jgi:shikimate 5-dehydrogenase
MHDTEGISPMSEKAFWGAEAAIDLIYRPEKSKFLQIAEHLGLNILNGAAMLFYQAYFADCLLLNKKPCEEQAKAFYEKYEKQSILRQN